MQTEPKTQPPRFSKPVRITEQVWPEGTVPVVSVFNWAYNHVEFIRESIESILMQETTFPVEIIIHDDASTDGTTEIIRQYEAKYPQLFRNIIQKENQWSQGKSVMVPMFTAPRGEFIALTHGDDYWTSPHKLQHQVDQMAEDKSLSLVGHCTDIVDNLGRPTGEPSIPSVSWPSRMDLTGYLRKGYFGFQISSWLFRTAALQGSQWILSLRTGDVPLMIHLASKGNIAFLPEHMSCYRRHATSFWAANPGSWQARAGVSLYRAAAAQLHGRPRKLAAELACRARFRLAEMLASEGRTCCAMFHYARFGVERSLLCSDESGLPSFWSALRRIKQLVAAKASMQPSELAK